MSPGSSEDMMNLRRASRSSGQLRLSTDGDPVRVSMCHCLACQRRTGRVFGVQARFERDDVSISGQSTRFVRTADSGNRITSNVCPACGSTVFYEAEAEPGLIGVPVGAFADPGFPDPTVSVYESRHHHWVRTPPSIERHD